MNTNNTKCSVKELQERAIGFLAAHKYLKSFLEKKNGISKQKWIDGVWNIITHYAELNKGDIEPEVLMQLLKEK